MYNYRRPPPNPSIDGGNQPLARLAGGLKRAIGHSSVVAGDHCRRTGVMITTTVPASDRQPS